MADPLPGVPCCGKTGKLSLVSGAPSWYYAVDTALEATTFTGVAVGGWVGYLRYLRGRLLHAKADFDLAAEIRTVGDREALYVRLSVLNSGTCRLTFPVSTTQLTEVCGVLSTSNHYRATGAVVLHARMKLISAVPGPAVSTITQHDAQERAVAESVSWRRGCRSLYPLALGPRPRHPCTYRADFDR